jgi:hypothetical protein
MIDIEPWIAAMGTGGLGGLVVAGIDQGVTAWRRHADTKRREVECVRNFLNEMDDLRLKGRSFIISLHRDQIKEGDMRLSIISLEIDQMASELSISVRSLGRRVKLEMNDPVLKNAIQEVVDEAIKVADERKPQNAEDPLSMHFDWLGFLEEDKVQNKLTALVNQAETRWKRAPRIRPNAAHI